MKYKYWYTQLSGIGNYRKRALLEFFGTAENIFLASENALYQAGILSREQLRALLQQRKDSDLQGEYLAFARQNTSLVTLEDAGYPEKLRELPDCPYGLFFRGTLPDPRQKMAAIVGARRCSPYGRMMAETLGQALGEAGYWVVSGMAKGIDGYAHRGCLNSGTSTAAVLGCGVDICYPRENKSLYESIRAQGCLLSEFPNKRQPLAAQFPQRNRIISGMASLVIVVEAREKSGSLITADFALEQGRDIYAVPGRINDPMSAGCNRLIAQGAGIITSVDDFLADLTDMAFTGIAGSLSDSATNLLLEKEETMVYSCFDFYPKGIEQVLEETGMELLPLLSVIMGLCDKGYLREYGKNQYVRMK
jgi:DNA processing protein